MGKRRPRAGGAVPQSPALCARLDTASCRLGAAQLRRARVGACSGRAGSARGVGGARAGAVAGCGSRGEWARGREEDRASQARCVARAGSKDGVSGGEDVLGWGTVGWSRGQEGLGHARGREERKEREGEGRRGKRKEKRKKMGKRKEKGGERNKERERGRARWR